MLKFQLCRVKKVSAEPQPLRVMLPASWLLFGELARGAVEGIADDRVIEGRHVDADLVSAACFNAHTDQREFTEAGCEPANHVIVRDGGTGVFGRSRSHTRATKRVTTDGCTNGSLVLLKIAVDKRNVSFANLAAGKQFPEGSVGSVVLGHDDQPTGVLVKPMHDSRTEDGSR